MCTKRSNFVFESGMWDQVDGLAMGNPLAPVLSELYMRRWENSFVDQIEGVHTWLRYVDDVFVVCHSDISLNSIENSLNSKDSLIQWSCAIESDGGIPFLDVFVERDSHSHLQTSVYQKFGTEPDIVKWSSNVPTSWLISTAVSHYQRCKLISSTVNSRSGRDRV